MAKQTDICGAVGLERGYKLPPRPQLRQMRTKDARRRKVYTIARHHLSIPEVADWLDVSPMRLTAWLRGDIEFESGSGTIARLHQLCARLTGGWS